MKILYVTEMWTGLAGILLHGDLAFKGMPAFYRVLERLVADGHEIDMLIHETDKAEYEMPIAPRILWMNQIHYTRCYLPFDRTGIWKPFSECVKAVAVYRATENLLKQNRYDIVYGHGPFSEAAGVAASRHGISFGQRRYGDFYYEYICRFGLLRAICSQPVNFWSYCRKKRFMVATNDGSNIDKLYKRLNGTRTPYPLYFWRNGYDPIPEEKIAGSQIIVPPKPYLLYVGRITEWKGQARAIELLHILKQNGIVLPLYLAGQIDSPAYYEKTCSDAASYGVAEQVHHLAALPLSDIAKLIPEALMCLSFYDISNFGNVFIEYVTNGGLVLSLNDGTLNDVILNGENGFLIDSMAEGADVVAQMLKEPVRCAQMKERASQKSHSYFMTWEQRIQKEIDLLQSTVDNPAL